MSNLPPQFSAPATPFPDVKGLIRSSEVTRPLPVLRPGVAIVFVGGALVVSVLPIQLGLRFGLELVLWALFAIFMAMIVTAIRAHRAESVEIDQIEDLLTLKRLYDVAPRLHWLMSSPMRNDQHRLRALLLLATTLARMQRYEDALLVYDELINIERIAGPAGAMIKTGRAMAMLQTDHLYDADRAINDLRRLIDRGGVDAEMREMLGPSANQETSTPAAAALRLVEIYRDVKTGHMGEAIEMFESNRELLRRGLGHRSGEAHALAAVAYDQTGNTDTARQRFADATALQGVADLMNRYPEVRALVGRYSPTPAPRF